MMKPSRTVWLLATVLIPFVGVGLLLHTVTAGSATVSGLVSNADGPLTGARVRIRATDNLTFTDDTGHFLLGGLSAGQEIEVTAWYTGHYIASTYVTPTVSGVTLTLRPYHTEDHPDYIWTSPISSTSDSACGNCHPMIVSQWITNAHGAAVSNLRFFSLYNGTNISGTAQIEPGYVDDFPGTAGNCANCHAPGAGVDGYLTTDMNDARDGVTAGIHCDYCHKVGGAYVDPVSGSVYRNAPGVQSQQVLRPPPGDNIFFGPYDDIHDPDTYLPLISRSQFCAPCHQFSFWGTPIYESFEEWLESPYAAEGITCQDCHMPPTGDEYFALPEVGGLPHPPDTIPSHRQVGAMDTDLLQETVTMTANARQIGDRLQVTIVITNSGAGHDVPTDHPGRHLLLTVQASVDPGQELLLSEGSTVPSWGGPQAGLPGKAFAKVLQDAQSGQRPVVSYWRQSLVYSDNRIPALSSDRSQYTFLLPAGTETVTVRAQLRFRRLFHALAADKGWGTPDVMMEEATVAVQPHPVYYGYLPLLRDP